MAPYYGTERSPFATGTMRSVRRATCSRTLSAAVDSARELTGAGFSTEARVVRGDPRDALVDTARTMGADLVVVGSHGRTGLAKLVLGSVASHVVTHSPCSVLVVKMK